jgi:hypothetical protein
MDISSNKRTAAMSNNRAIVSKGGKILYPQRNKAKYAGGTMMALKAKKYLRRYIGSMETPVCTIQYRNTIKSEPLVIFALAGRALGKFL